MNSYAGPQLPIQEIEVVDLWYGFQMLILQAFGGGPGAHGLYCTQGIRNVTTRCGRSMKRPDPPSRAFCARNGRPISMTSAGLSATGKTPDRQPGGDLGRKVNETFEGHRAVVADGFQPLERAGPVKRSAAGHAAGSTRTDAHSPDARRHRQSPVAMLTSSIFM